MIFDIQRFSINDGPGIRTNVFFKGCPLSCVWCHNPESKSFRPEIFYNPEKCVGCGGCAALCPCGCHALQDAHLYRREDCLACGKCVPACPSGALEYVGKDMTVEEILAVAMKDLVFYETSGGGLTLSGGEPMAQFPFTLALLQAAKRAGLHVCMETCGFASAEQFKEAAKFVDIFLYDYKETDPVRHREYTGVSNEQILQNLLMLDELGAKTVLRCPIIPSLNDRDEHFDGIAALANRLQNILEINIEPYHPLGSGKSAMLGRDYPLGDLSFPEDALVQSWIDRIAAKTAVPVKKA